MVQAVIYRAEKFPHHLERPGLLSVLTQQGVTKQTNHVQRINRAVDGQTRIAAAHTRGIYQRQARIDMRIGGGAQRLVAGGRGISHILRGQMQHQRGAAIIGTPGIPGGQGGAGQGQFSGPIYVTGGLGHTHIIARRAHKSPETWRTVAVPLSQALAQHGLTLQPNGGI